MGFPSCPNFNVWPLRHQVEARIRLPSLHLSHVLER